MFRIEDERHAELQEGEYVTMAAAMAELRRRATLPWDKAPNAAPCTNWQNCGRTYEIVEFDTASIPWKELQRVAVLEVTAGGAGWLSGFEHGG
jgi:hypothetical protein